MSTSLLTRFVHSLKHKDLAAVELNSDQTAELHRKQIQSKQFLRRFYNDMYDTFAAEADAVKDLPGRMVELGSGAGFLKERIPEVMTSDVSPFPFVDRVIFADKLPFANEGLKALFALNVLHHLTDAEAFFRDADRALVRGGRMVLIEPHCSLWGRFIYTYLHYEPFDMNTPDWKLPDSGRLETANGALPYIIFNRDRERFERLFPNLRVKSLRYHTVLRYLLSGGVSWPALMPTFTYSFFRTIDNLLSRATWTFPIFQTIVIEKV